MIIVFVLWPLRRYCAFSHLSCFYLLHCSKVQTLPLPRCDFKSSLFPCCNCDADYVMLQTFKLPRYNSKPSSSHLYESPIAGFSHMRSFLYSCYNCEALILSRYYTSARLGIVLTSFDLITSFAIANPFVALLNAAVEYPGT